MRNDRTVHASNGQQELVRYNREGHWYVESPGIPRYKVTISEAVDHALRFGWTPHLGLPGGSTFDSRVRKAQR